ncbi:CBP family penicillin-hydrolyzing class A beta-lactamase [Clostridium botulinum]|uniref:CBP family penicillin-hydrolyzing class A beta-lactamase n=1 Tax=Clostridium botulinum TaxID=1491 RepID=UPI0001F85041|nr:CBP family penicillin-hydrolyzing class A beta-lactamase [Clostridium botulinum]MCJ8171192.1 CBP family penicillin-hydrolyzing class A beta-lactamase [Clostridium botulinum]NFB15697.1 CBP family penicillin-hydrolyzing class A beta-lactamase [Clostridium botulinum]NFB66121.1 CBP family penicillin-hydrolyzing class A beta-lactamase [Clostridium botulinum]NFB96919.1 CBP family penicillin-hydrolyzing class A beta-lactamase [Clostridium botulinum]NFC45916.1 CBP family penicillin-hydrolyzing clas
MKKIVNSKLKLNKFKMCIFISILIFSLTGCGNVENKTSENTKPEIQYNSAFSKIESDYGVKLGVYAFNTETNKEVTYNADKRFAYCSTFKSLISGAILQKYSSDQLKQVIKYSPKDVLSYAPVTKNHVDKGMTIEELCDAAVRFSDNTAANLLINLIGGPNGFKSALNQLGDTVTEPARIEPELNVATPGDNRDTSTPRQLSIDLKEYTTGNILSDDKKKILIDWMSGNATGDKLIRAGAPKDWMVSDKSGTGSYGTRNDIAIVIPPNKKPIFVAILSSKNAKDAKYDDKTISEASKIVFDYFINTRK